MISVENRRFLGEGTYGAYPHCNGFTADGLGLIYGRVDPEGISLFRLTLKTGESVALPPASFFSEKDRLAWFDVALRAPRMAAVFGGKGWVLDLEEPSAWRCVYVPASGYQLQGLCSLAAKGDKVLFGEERPGDCRLVELDLETGRAQILFSQAWLANHFHYCPKDESWVGFSHEGPTLEISDRMWIWHVEREPKGRCVFDQRSAEPGRWLRVGHERWNFHDISAYTVAYAVSEAGPRGIYEVFADERPPRLVWPCEVAWHCNGEASGRYLTIDTFTPGDEGVPPSSEVWVMDLRTGERCRIDCVGRSNHPYHPHPALSARGEWVIYNDTGLKGPAGAWIASLRFS